jgi:hypothetical protein
MPAGADNVCLSGRTGSGRSVAKTALLTHTGCRALSRTVAIEFALADTAQAMPPLSGSDIRSLRFGGDFRRSSFIFGIFS